MKRNYVGVVTKSCEVCGTPVTRQASQFRTHTFCSKRCYWDSPHHREAVAAANAKRHPFDSFFEKPCAQCGVTVRRHRSRMRNRTFCSRPCRERFRAERSKPQLRADGYVTLYVGAHYPGADKSGHIKAHRKVMQEVLGRALWPDENVHHKNGVRHDNRPENLELWSTSQPSGQRVAEKLEWAREFIAQYEGTPMI